MAEKHNDVPLSDFIEGSLLEEQVDSVQKCAEVRPYSIYLFVTLLCILFFIIYFFVTK